MVNVHDGSYFFVSLHGIIYNMRLKCPTSAHMHVFETCTPLVNGCVNCALFNAVSNAYLHNRKVRVTKDTLNLI